jgi:death-on-curing protein
MEAVKIRKQGNSMSVTLDQATLQAANLREGDRVSPTVRNGLVVLVPVEIRPRVLEVGRRVIARNRRVLDRLARGWPEVKALSEADSGSIIYVELEEALALHAEIKGLSIDAARAELLHEDRLESALIRPRQAAHYADADLAQQAALLLCGIAETQPFIDGNKRTALVVALTFLELNGFVVDLSEDELFRLMHEIADNLPEADVGDRLRDRLRHAGPA